MSGSLDQTIKVWDSGEFRHPKCVSLAKADIPLPPDAATLSLLSESTNAHSDKVRSVAFSPDGSKIVSGSDDFSIKVWDWMANLGSHITLTNTVIDNALAQGLNSVHIAFMPPLLLTYSPTHPHILVPVPPLLVSLQHGGAIFASGSVTFMNVTISNAVAARIRPNEGKALGGGLALNASVANVQHARFERCQADTLGGGIWAMKSLLHISQCTFRSNTALQGAALMYESTRTVDDEASTVKESLFQDNAGNWSIVDYLNAAMEWSCERGQYMRRQENVTSGDFYGCARLCAPGTVWKGPDHRDGSCGGLCPLGFFCERGQLPTACPAGRFMPSEGAMTGESCLLCKSPPPAKGLCSAACS